MLRRLLARLHPAPVAAETQAAQDARLLDRLAALRALPEAKGVGALRLIHRTTGRGPTVLLGATLPIAIAAQACLLHHPDVRHLLAEADALPHPLALLAYNAARTWFLPDVGLADLLPGVAPPDPFSGAASLSDGV